MELSNIDHTFLTVGRLGSGISDRLIGGDCDTWGEGSEQVGDIDVLIPTLGSDGPSIMVCRGKSIDLQEWEIDEDELKSFLSDAFEGRVRNGEISFILWELSDTMFGEALGEKSGFDLDEWPVADLEKVIGKDLAGRLIVHSNKRYNCAVKINSDGVVEWADDIDPDDDSQYVAVFKGAI